MSAPISPWMPAWMEEAAAFILDLDGTLWRGGQPLPGAATLLARLEGRFVVVSNNSTDLAAGLATTLADLGLAVPAARILLAGETAVARVARLHPGAAVMVVGSPTLRQAAERLGLRPAARWPEVVLLARDPGFDYAALMAAANALRAGARLVVANPDLTHPGVDGGVVPETGSLLRALLACAGDVGFEMVGKPQPALFTEALARLGTPPGRTVVIGDNPATDAAGAVACGMPFLLVGDSALADATDPAGLLTLARPARRVLPGEDTAAESTAQNRLIDSTSKVCRMVSTARS